MNAMPHQTDLEEFTGTAIDANDVNQRIEQHAQNVDRIQRDAIIDIGRELAKSQELHRYKGGDEGFVKWLARRLPHIPQASAYRMIEIANGIQPEMFIKLINMKTSTLSEVAKAGPDIQAIIAERVSAGEVFTAAQVKELRTRISDLEKQSNALERGKDLAVKDAEEAESKASAVEKEMDERVSIAVTEAAQKIEAGFKDEIRRLQLENAELRKPKPVAIVEGHTAEIVPFARDLTDEEKAEIDAEHDEYQDADFIETASDKDRAISVFGAIRNIATVKASPVAVYQHIASHSRVTVDEYMSMVDYSLALLTTIKDYHHD
ncbi:hypothetical protein [Ochrobactrum soli]|uniref:Uncharacterized protein n=1 Tax=Ochrobactrum soli TaxID=2448455 RepID=A0A2P9HN22_9HYPH|nr:hypothetical protein [[Ochrobactrum] soli]SPL65403.1 hypothetical protein OHAE_1270 [[Ochrobactrum] soli]